MKIKEAKNPNVPKERPKEYELEARKQRSIQTGENNAKETEKQRISKEKKQRSRGAASSREAKTNDRRGKK